MCDMSSCVGGFVSEVRGISSCVLDVWYVSGQRYMLCRHVSEVCALPRCALSLSPDNDSMDGNLSGCMQLRLMWPCLSDVHVDKKLYFQVLLINAVYMRCECTCDEWSYVHSSVITSKCSIIPAHPIHRPPVIHVRFQCPLSHRLHVTAHHHLCFLTF